ncbi:TM2 domain-containing protein [Apibacter adventoris]|uniref:TM2 domain-containing protein n=1 Tax=Apibacter adventoris TaxID=1679466 RepID=A0A2S8AB05_9FLAO|nr:TM2 domain-containing protein [Apibacter adventoris]PQL91681.1 hypothetical protein C4S77_07730 [Apibacter adventoris]
MEQTNYPQNTNSDSGITSSSNPQKENKKIIAGILGILFGSFGIHKFILGYNKEGLIMLLVSILTCGLGSTIMGPIGLIEGIIYLTKSDEDFYNTYQVNHKGWF